MARKHNTQHNRGKSKYPERLKRRGMSSASVRMDDLDTLRKRQRYYLDDTTGIVFTNAARIAGSVI